MNPSQLTILYVDDTGSQRYAISRMLASAGFTVVQAATGRQGLELAKGRPDLILLDVKLPDIDGFEVCRLLKADPETSGIPILQVSAEFREPEHKATALESGADGYLVHPLNAIELTATVQALVRARLAKDDARKQYLKAEAELARREKAEHELRESVNQLRALFENAMDAMTIWDEQGHFLDVNPAACRLFGYGREELLGSRVEDFVAPEDKQEVSRALRPGKEERAAKGEFTLIGKDGSRRIIEYTATVDYIPGQHLSIMRDISQRKKDELEIRQFNQNLERRVAERTAQLQEINRELEAFSYSVSHDLRAPFRHIAGFSELLQKRLSVTDDVARHYVQTIAESARYAGTLVDNLLAFSRMGRSEVRQRRIGMDGLLEEVLRDLAPEMAGRNIEWKISALGEVKADAVMLRLALQNLVANALKYTRKRSRAVIEIGAERGENENVYFVRDNGVGFDMRYVDKLFGVFQRLHRMEDFEGTGIGLASVRRIVQRHGGRTWAVGEPDVGATFYFSLPNEGAVPDALPGQLMKEQVNG